MLCTSSFPCSSHKALRRIILLQNRNLCNQRIPQETRGMQTETLPFRPGCFKRPRRISFLHAKWMLPFSPLRPAFRRLAALRQTTPVFFFQVTVFPLCHPLGGLLLRSIKLLVSLGRRSVSLFPSKYVPASDPSNFLSAEVGGQTRLWTLKCM